jgi:hypothetical protein
MTANNKLEKSFGTVGAYSGNILFLAGIVLFIIYSSLIALFLLCLGAFVGFSSTSVLIDFDNKRVKFLNNLWGIIPYGQWMDINPDMKIGIRKSNLKWRTYSRGNRTLDIDTADFLVILFNSEEKEIMPLKKAVSLIIAKVEAESIRDQLELSMI